MAKNPNEGGLNRHKAMAMGKKIALKEGGVAKKSKPKKK